MEKELYNWWLVWFLKINSAIAPSAITITTIITLKKNGVLEEVYIPQLLMPTQSHFAILNFLSSSTYYLADDSAVGFICVCYLIPLNSKVGVYFLNLS